MTIILNQAKPNNNFLLLKPKRQIREGDIVIFQYKDLIGDTGVTEDKEESVAITSVQEGDGLMKGYQIISWSEAK